MELVLELTRLNGGGAGSDEGESDEDESDEGESNEGESGRAKTLFMPRWEIGFSTILCVYTLSIFAHWVRVTHNRCWGRASPVLQDRLGLDVRRIVMRGRGRREMLQRKFEMVVGYLSRS